MVGDSQYTNFFCGDHIDDGVGEVPHIQSPLPVEPQCSKQRTLHQQLNRALKLGKK
jgi:hypothetical protein